VAVTIMLIPIALTFVATGVVALALECVGAASVFFGVSGLLIKLVEGRPISQQTRTGTLKWGPPSDLKSAKIPENDFKTSGLYARCCSAEHCGALASGFGPANLRVVACRRGVRGHSSLNGGRTRQGHGGTFPPPAYRYPLRFFWRFTGGALKMHEGVPIAYRG